MRLQLNRVISTGTTMLDQGITDLSVAVIDGVVHLYSTTGRNGGIVDYVVGSTGTVTVSSSVIFPPNITAIVSDRLVLTSAGGDVALIVGSQGESLIGFSLDGLGRVSGPITEGWGEAISQAGAGSSGHLTALVTMSEAPMPIFPGNFDCTQIIELVQITVAGQVYVLAACDAVNGVVALRQDAGTGALTVTGNAGAMTGLGVDAPTAMEVVSLGGQTYVILAAAGTSSLSVMRVMADGSLLATDHVIDTGATRFEGVQALGVAQYGDHVFVIAGGADNGITLFALLPDGTLVTVQTIADAATTSMFKVSAITTAISGNQLHIFVGSQNEGGVTQFSIDLANLGSLMRGTGAAEVLTGGAGSDILMAQGSGDTLVGGGGDDILVSGDGQTVMTGGAGRDVFVVRDGSGTTQITDFRVGEDRIDLSDLPLLRSTGQLTITTTATGAIITFRDTVIHVTSATNTPLTVADLFPNGFDWGDRFPVGVPPGLQGVFLVGGKGNDRFDGTELNDTLIGGRGADSIYAGMGDDSIEGGGGHDLILSEGGNNLIWGGNGKDTIEAGDGNDTLSGDGGKDRLVGGAGDDLLDGGNGADRIFGGDGNDTIDGGGGPDKIWAGDGNDLVHGGAGRNRIWLEAGNDTAFGGNDADRIDGGNGHDLIYGGGGNDSLFGGNGNDSLFGDDGNDMLNGDAGNDMVGGGNGNDTIIGGDGNDWLSGMSGNDLIYGGAGNDTIRGGNGNDTMWGGDGADVFEFFRDHESGRIMDFDGLEGDILRLDDWIWHNVGTLTVQQVVDQFGVMDADGNVMLDFTEIGGNLVILDGYTDLANLPDYIELM